MRKSELRESKSFSTSKLWLRGLKNRRKARSRNSERALINNFRRRERKQRRRREEKLRKQGKEQCSITKKKRCSISLSTNKCNRRKNKGQQKSKKG